MLAAILERLRGQQTCILELQDQLGKERAARELLQGKVDWVVKQTEDGKNDVTDEVVRSFEERLQDLSRTGAAAKQASRHHSATPRCAASLPPCSARLHSATCCLARR